MRVPSSCAAFAQSRNIAVLFPCDAIERAMPAAPDMQERMPFPLPCYCSTK